MEINEIVNSTQANEEINERLTKIIELLSECESIADEHKVSFIFDGPSYGMGGSYHPRNQWVSSDCEGEDGWSDSGCSDGDYDGGWSASSQSC